MTYTKHGNYSKVSFQADIKRRQAAFNRFKRRYQASKNPTERRFLKNEATKVVTELRQWSKKWQTWGFGGNTWITKNFTVTYFTTTTGARKTSAYKSPTCKTYGKKNTGRSYSSRKGSTGMRTNSQSRTRTSGTRRNYTAW
ncbi:MAG: hypothetical protein ABII12_02015 [Planctomycetota bacterium]